MNNNNKTAKKSLHKGANRERLVYSFTTTNLDIALRMVGYQLDIAFIDKIIDLVKLIEDKGDNVTIKDICDLQSEWESNKL